MDVLKSATFGTLFGVAFAVGEAFQLVLGVLGLLMAILAPNSFTMNGARVANPGQALMVLILMLFMGAIMNVTVAAAGSGLWLLVRRWIAPAKASATAG